MPSIIDEISLPYIPVKVNLDDLGPNNKLLPEDQINHTITTIEGLKKPSHKILHSEPFARRFKKTELNTPYDIIAFDENYYAVYYGAQRGKYLGSGGFGYVKLVQNLKTGEWAVLKLMAVDKKHSEYHLLQQVDLALGYLERKLPMNKNNTFVKYQQQQKLSLKGSENRESVYQANLLMKLADGMALDELAKGNYNLPVSKWIEILIQVAKDYKRLKDKNIIHKDIKPKNIFYSFEKNKATIIDLGGSRKKSLFVTKKQEKEIYTMGYIAPELLFKTHYNEATDIYALGKTFLNLLDLSSPSMTHIKDTAPFFKLYRYCFYRMNNKVAKDRPSIEEVIQFFETLQQSCSNLLPKPFRKIALLSVDEFMQGVYEAHSKELVEEESTILALKGKELVEGKLEEGITLPNPQGIQKGDEQAFMPALQLFDEVWFIDTSKREQKDYIQLRRQLEAQKIIVGQRCFLTEDKNLSEALPAILEKIGQANLSKGNKYFFITGQTEINQPANLCLLTLEPKKNQKYYQKIIEAYTRLDIQKEYQTIIDALSPLASQYEIVNDTLADLDKHFSEGTLSLDYLKDSLRELRLLLPTLEDKKAPESSHYNATFFSKNGHHKSQSVKYIKQIDTQVDDWVSSYQM